MVLGCVRPGAHRAGVAGMLANWIAHQGRGEHIAILTAMPTRTRSRDLDPISRSVPHAGVPPKFSSGAESVADQQDVDHQPGIDPRAGWSTQ